MIISGILTVFAASRRTRRFTLHACHLPASTLSYSVALLISSIFVIFPLNHLLFLYFFPVSFFCFLLSLPCLFSVVFIVIFPFFPSFFRSLPWPLSSHAIAPVPEAPFLPGRPSPVMYSSTAVEDFLRRGKGKRLRAGAGNCKAGAAIFLHSLIFGS